MVSAKFRMLFQLFWLFHEKIRYFSSFPWKNTLFWPFSMKKYANLAISIYHRKIRWTKEHLFRWKRREIAYNRQGIYFSVMQRKYGGSVHDNQNQCLQTLYKSLPWQHFIENFSLITIRIRIRFLPVE